MRSFIIFNFHQILLRRSNQRKKRRTEYVAYMEEMRNEYKIFIGNPEGKRPRGKASSN
jgi:hypothetical protein